MMATVRLLYFASLREAAGLDGETVQSAAADLARLYEETAARHALLWPRERLRVAVDGAFARWEDPLADGSEVAFISPVSGG